MTEWILDLECTWKTAAESKPTRFRLEKPRIIPQDDQGGAYARGLLGFNPSQRTLETAGMDPAQVKRLAIALIRNLLDFEKAELVGDDGEPLDLEALTPIYLEDHDGVARVPPPGHGPDINWAIDLECSWGSVAGTQAFRLRIARPHSLGNGEVGCEISADHPLLGDVIVRGNKLKDLEYPIEYAFTDIADWYRAQIVDKDGTPVDFTALARKIVQA